MMVVKGIWCEDCETRDDHRASNMLDQQRGPCFSAQQLGDFSLVQWFFNYHSFGERPFLTALLIGLTYPRPTTVWCYVI